MMGVLLTGLSARGAEVSPENFIERVETSALRIAPVLSGGRVGGFERSSTEFWARIGGSKSPVFGGDGASLSASAALLALWMAPEDLEDVPLVLVDAPLGEGRAVTIRAADALVQRAGGSLDRGIMRSAARAEERLRLLGVTQRDVFLAAWDGASWVSVDDPGAPEEVRIAWEEVRSAWIARDAQRTNAALAALADALEETGSGVSARWKRELEWAMERWGVFRWCAAGFVLSALCWLVIGLRAGKTPVRLGLGVQGACVGVLLAAFAARGIVAERLPVQNQFESMLGLALLVGAIGLAWAWRRGSGSLPGENPGAGPLPGAGAMVGGVSAAGSAVV
ncbi:MAG: hypothetical protein EA380_09360, partial [Phycisphaeraceae bacterium]